MKKLFTLVLTVSLFVLIAACAQATSRIAILQPMSHASLDQIRETIVARLNESGADIEINTGNANSDSTALVTRSRTTRRRASISSSPSLPPPLRLPEPSLRGPARRSSSLRCPIPGPQG